MLEYFGFYTPRPETTEHEEAEREAEVTRAARLGERPRHSPTCIPVGHAWERTPSREGPSRS